MKSMTPEKAGRDKSQYRQTLKGLRAAEARLRFELLQEQRLLQNHVADFWDASLDRHSGNVRWPPQECSTRDGTAGTTSSTR
mgnify:CR=1 FL=1